MNYDQRISYLKNWIKTDILPRFNMPKDLDPKIVAMDVIEAVNSNIPNGTDAKRMSQLVASIAKEVAQSARSRTLPPVKDFIDATRKATSAYADRSITTTTKPKILAHKISADRIRQRQPVSDYYITGTGRKILIEEYGMKNSDFEPYDVALAAHMQ